MITQNVISHRMFVAALAQGENVAGKIPGVEAKAAKTAGGPVRSDVRPGPKSPPLTPHQMMLSILNEGFQTSDI